MTTDVFTVATPRPRTVKDSWGDPCRAATPESYPLRAVCDECGATIVCADSTADWGHKRTGQARCTPDPAAEAADAITQGYLAMRARRTPSADRAIEAMHREEMEEDHRRHR